MKNIMEIIIAFMLLVFFIVVILGITLLYSFVSLAPWVPTLNRDMERINRLADLKERNIFYEIGCGSARVSYYIAKHNPQTQVVGIELALPLYIFAKLKSLLGPKNLRIEFGDALLKNYSDVDVVYVFGLPKTVNGKLKGKLENELKSGAKYISYAFTVNDWKGSKCWEDKPGEKDNAISICVK